MKKISAIAAFVFLIATVFAQDPSMKVSTVTSTPQWEKLKSLTGEWEGYAGEGGNKTPAKISVRLTGDGSALMHWMGAGTPHEMITMFHMDKDELLATHYCAAHNQPRMRALPSQQRSRVSFEFKDGTNIRPGDGFMRSLEIAFIDADHHDEIWGFDNNGKVEAMTFHMTRVSQPGK